MLWFRYQAKAYLPEHVLPAVENLVVLLYALACCGRNDAGSHSSVAAPYAKDEAVQSYHVDTVLLTSQGLYYVL